MSVAREPSSFLHGHPNLHSQQGYQSNPNHPNNPTIQQSQQHQHHFTGYTAERRGGCKLPPDVTRLENSGRNTGEEDDREIARREREEWERLEWERAEKERTERSKIERTRAERIERERIETERVERDGPVLKNIAKGTTDTRVEFISRVKTKILIKFHLQNLDQGSNSKSQPNISLSIKLKLQNLDQT